MGVVTRGMGATGCFGGACEGARADPACGAAARASGQELGKATVGHEIGVPSVARAQRAGAGASAKRGALVRAEGDERYKSIRRRVAATDETTIHDLPVRLSSAVSPSQPHPCFSLILSTRTALDPARVLHALTEPAPRDPRHAAPQDHLLEVVFGHLAADSKPREYFDATLTCVPSRAFSTLRLATRETRALLSELSFRETASVSSNLCVFAFAFSLSRASLQVSETRRPRRRLTLAFRRRRATPRVLAGARVSASRPRANTRSRTRTSRCWTSEPRSGSPARARSPRKPSRRDRRARRFSSAASTSTARDRTRVRTRSETPRTQTMRATRPRA